MSEPPAVTSSPDRPLERQTLVPASRWGAFVLIAALLAAAFGLRLFMIDQIEFAPLRQHRSAILARAFYYDSIPDVPAWERVVSAEQRRVLGLLEPPVLEYLASRLYLVAGGEHLWIPRTTVALCWVLSGLLLSGLARRLTADDGALVAMAFYLLLPMAVVAGRAFQPHPVAVALVVAALYAICRYDENPARSWLLLGAAPAAAVGLIYGPGLLFVFGGYAGLVVARRGARGLVAPAFLGFAVLTLLPAAAYYGHGAITGSGVRGQLLSSVKPYLLQKPTFWAGWLAQIHSIVGLPVLAVAAAGLHAARGRLKALLIGLWTTYVVYGLTFAYHISTHDYYQLLFIPIVALSLAPAALWLLRHLRHAVPAAPVRLALFGACALLSAAAGGVKIIEYNFDRHGRWQRNEREIAQTIGERVGHSTKIAYLSISGGYPLFYHGKVSGLEIQVRNEVLERYLEEKPGVDPSAIAELGAATGFAPEYFVMTELLELKRQPALKRYLDAHYTLLVHETDYLVYDLRPQSASALAIDRADARTAAR